MNKEILIVSFNWKNKGGTQKRAELLKKNLSKYHKTDHIFINSYVKFNLFKINKIILNIKGILKYRKILKQYKIVIAFSNLPSLFSILSKPNLITVITGSTFHYKEAKFISKAYWILILEPLIYLFAKKIIPAAPHLIPLYIRKTNLHSKVHYINGFIDLDELKINKSLKNDHEYKFSNINLENCICLSSELISHKGIIEFLEIYLEYRNRSRNDYLKLIIIGNGVLLSDCIKFCRNKGLKYQRNLNSFSNDKDIFFTEHLKNPLNIIQKCRLFVMPSFHEGLSNQLLEAIYSGIPIIASNCLGNNFVYNEILKENHDYINSGFLKLMPIIKNRKIKTSWVKELINYSKNYKNIRYEESNKLISKFSSKENSLKWKFIIRRILEEEKNKIQNK